MKTKFQIIAQTDSEWLPQNSIAPEGAWYVEFEYDGRPTGVWVSVGEGERLPIFSSLPNAWRIARRSTRCQGGDALERPRANDDDLRRAAVGSNPTLPARTT